MADTAPVRRAAPALSPKARLRLFWLRLHRWIALTAMLAVLAIAITGMSLVWRGPVERMFHGDRFPQSSAPSTASPSAMLAAAAQALPASNPPLQIQFAPPGGAAVVTGVANGPPIIGIGPPRRPRVWIDPADGAVLSVSDGSPDYIFIAKAIHGHMLIAPIGRWLMALVGLSLLFLAGTGLWLWWPGRKNIVKSLKWRKQLSKSMNLHRIVGPLASLGLIAQSFTGIFMALPWLLSIGTNTPARPPAAKPSKPLAAPQRDADAALAAATPLAGGKRIVSIQLPTEATPRWTLALAGGASVAVDDLNGAATFRPAPPAAAGADAREAVAALHEGEYGLLHKLLLTATGAALALYAITGILLWTQGRKRKHR
ncbi:MAG: PepSY domain-containing protein [Sphingomonadales bacterium]|nr:MAG: PepSY domain-containing protein [Sphingomonadales bacterium]